MPVKMVPINEKKGQKIFPAPAKLIKWPEFDQFETKIAPLFDFKKENFGRILKRKTFRRIKGKLCQRLALMVRMKKPMI